MQLIPHSLHDVGREPGLPVRRCLPLRGVVPRRAAAEEGHGRLLQGETDKGVFTRIVQACCQEFFFKYIV